MELSEFLDTVMRCIYPRKCIFCRKALTIDFKDYICHKCAKDITPIKGKICEKCGLPIDHDGLCRRCVEVKRRFDRAYAVYEYRDEVRDAIHRFKYGDRAGYAEFFGRKLAELASLKEIERADYAVPVPISDKRLLKRGYNQCALMAEVFCRERGENMADLLKRVKNTKPQSGLRREERAKNVKNAFGLKDENIDLKGKTIILIDDIFTTGSTADECAAVLKRAGAAKVYVLCFSISVNLSGKQEYIKSLS